MALNKTDTTILYLLKSDRKKIYTQLVQDTEAGETGLATADQLRRSANQLANIIRQNATAQAAVNQELDDKIELGAAVKMEIRTSHGNVFKNNFGETRLIVTIQKMGENITNILQLHAAFGDTARLEWSYIRENEQQYTPIPSDDPHIESDGFVLVCRSNDVDTTATFNCALIIE